MIVVIGKVEDTRVSLLELFGVSILATVEALIFESVKLSTAHSSVATWAHRAHSSRVWLSLWSAPQLSSNQHQ